MSPRCDDVMTLLKRFVWSKFLEFARRRSMEFWHYVLEEAYMHAE